MMTAPGNRAFVARARTDLTHPGVIDPNTTSWKSSLPPRSCTTHTLRENSGAVIQKHSAKRRSITILLAASEQVEAGLIELPGLDKPIQMI